MNRIACTEIVFDLDGTLWSPLSLSLTAWHTACQEFGFSVEQLTAENLLKMYGMTLDDASRFLLPGSTVKQQEQISERVFAMENRMIAQGHGDLYPQVKEILNVLSQTKRLFIASNCQMDYIEAFLKAKQLEDLFCDTICFGETMRPKAENVATLVERNSIANAIVVGDASTDLHAARQTGVPFVYAAYGFGKVSEYDYKLERFADLLELLDY